MGLVLELVSKIHRNYFYCMIGAYYTKMDLNKCNNMSCPTIKLKEKIF